MELALKESVKKPDGTAASRSSLRAPAAGNPVRRPAAARSFLQLRPEDGENGRSEERPRPNRTGLPNTLKTSLENRTGLSLDEVRVHYNSSRPARYGALAFAKGTEIHVAPGQEKSLPHEAWHVVQQMQGRVTPNARINGEAANTDSCLEREADEMGVKALSMGKSMLFLGKRQSVKIGNPVIQCFDDKMLEIVNESGEGVILDKAQLESFKNLYATFLVKVKKGGTKKEAREEIVEKIISAESLFDKTFKAYFKDEIPEVQPDASAITTAPLKRTTSSELKTEEGKTALADEKKLGEIKLVNVSGKSVDSKDYFDVTTVIKKMKADKTKKEYYTKINNYMFQFTYFKDAKVTPLTKFGLAYIIKKDQFTWKNLDASLEKDFAMREDKEITRKQVIKDILYSLIRRPIPPPKMMTQSVATAIAYVACDYIRGIRGEHAINHLISCIEDVPIVSFPSMFENILKVTKVGGRKLVEIINSVQEIFDQFNTKIIKKGNFEKLIVEQEINIFNAFGDKKELADVITKSRNAIGECLKEAKIPEESYRNFSFFNSKSTLKKNQKKGTEVKAKAEDYMGYDSDSGFSKDEGPAAQVKQPVISAPSVPKGPPPVGTDMARSSQPATGESRKRKNESGTDKKGDTDTEQTSEPAKKKSTVESPAPSFPPSPSTSLSGKDAADMAPQQNLPEPSQFPLSPEPRAPIPEPFSDDEDSEMEDAQKSASADKSTASEEPDKPKYGEEDSVTDTEDL